MSDSSQIHGNSGFGTPSSEEKKDGVSGGKLPSATHKRKADSDLDSKSDDSKSDKPSDKTDPMTDVSDPVADPAAVPAHTKDTTPSTKERVAKRLRTTQEQLDKLLESDNDGNDKEGPESKEKDDKELADADVQKLEAELKREPKTSESCEPNEGMCHHSHETAWTCECLQVIGCRNDLCDDEDGNAGTDELHDMEGGDLPEGKPVYWALGGINKCMKCEKPISSIKDCKRIPTPNHGGYFGRYCSDMCRRNEMTRALASVP
jgi:hypothetical protein